MTNDPSEEKVVLVDEADRVLGAVPKSGVHTLVTPLHRAFSIFIFNERGEVLIQQRSHKKKTWPLDFSTSCCGHPAPDETRVDAARRRVLFELGLELESVEMVAPYRYRVTKDSVTENEVCPILLGVAKGEVKPNPDEVESFFWISWSDFIKETKEKPGKYSPWCAEEAEILQSNAELKKLLSKLL